MYRSEALNQFSRHTPRILRRQIILQLVEQYLGEEVTDADELAVVCKPSLQRFHGALLFVDISGFTVLSQRLNVEELKNHINEYFTKMLDIVDRREGDVIKFAGDALFIVWESFNGTTATPDELSRQCLEKAVECGREINEVCGNHKIVINASKPSRSSFSSSKKLEDPPSPTPSAGGFFKDSHSISGTKLTPIEAKSSFEHNPNSTSNEEEYAYLNVHSGVSMGTMAGVDIGADNRWEYFLIGEPLSRVAEAESLASSGDIIICPDSHAVLHQEFLPKVAKVLNNLVSNIRLKFKHEHDDNATLPCGCVVLKDGYCKISISSSPSNEKQKRKSRTNRKGSLDDTNPILAGIRMDIDEAYSAFEGRFMKEFLKHIGDSFNESKLSASKVQESFIRWAHACLTDDVARHVHHVMRSEYTFSNISRYGVFQRAIEEQTNASISLTGSNLFTQDALSLTSSPILSMAEEQLHVDAAALSLRPLVRTPVSGSRSPALGVDPSQQFTPIASKTEAIAPPSATVSPLVSDALLSDESANNSGRSSPVHSSTRSVSRRSNALLRATFSSTGLPNAKSSMSAEMRTVTVMFVKIAMPKVELLIDSSRSHVKIGGNYRFLSRTVNECISDLMLVNRFQKCISALSEAFASHGGQMRQFIVDDKGTVCIGTFGLRGSVSDDNAAAALDTAHMIVLKLQTLGIESSIGVTVGKAYCGQVGSTMRHEYAVMGPSTNLSARLMCKAPPYGIICDNETRKRDRTHGFVTLTDIVAKGYVAPVGTFKPVFPEEEDILSLSAKVNLQDGLLKSIHGIKSATSTDTNLFASIANCQGKKVLFMMTGNQKMSFKIDSKNDKKMELHGRNEEIGSIISFSFSALLKEDGEVPMQSSPERGAQPRPVFDHTLPSRFIGVTGTHGIGKTCLVSSITGQLSVVVKKAPGCNVQIFKSRSDSYNLNVPFVAWKPIVLDIMIRIYRNRKSQQRRRSFTVGIASTSSEIVEAINYTMEQLPAELHEFKPLFGYLSMITPNNEALLALQLTGQERLIKCMELLIAILHLYTNVMKNVIFILMEDIYLFDRSSLRMLLEVFKNGKGIVILFTGRSHSVNHKTTEQDSDPLQGVLSALTDSERFLEVPLTNLTKESTTALVQSVLSTYNYGEVEIDPHLYEKVYEVTGGNPFYAFEIAKSLTENSDLSLNFSAKISTLHCMRIEEIICYRFDQLKNSAQTFLKLAAVVCANGSTFTLAMLTHIDDGKLILEHTGPNSHALQCFSVVEEVSEAEHVMAYAHILLSILTHEHFIRFSVNQENIFDPDKEELTVELLLANNYSFEFCVSVELSTIYNLLLDDQKQAIHEELAEFYENERDNNANFNELGPALQTQQYLKEAFHWESACMWSHGMVCYYKAFCFESEINKKFDYLETSYQMYCSLKDQHETTADPKGISLANMQQLFEDTFVRDGHSRSELGLGSRSDDPADNVMLTLERVFQIFEGDSDLLNAGLNVLIQIALRNIRRFDDCKQTLLMLEDGLQMMLLSKNPFLMDSKYTALLHSVLRKNQNHKKEHVASADDMHFSLKNFDSMYFHLVSTYLMNFEMSNYNVESEEAQKAAYLGTSFLAMAKMNGKPAHIIQALITNTLLEVKAWNLEQALVYTEDLHTRYVFEDHSRPIIDAYGADFCAYMLIRVSQFVLLTKDRGTSDHINAFAIRFIGGLTAHVPSLLKCIFPIISTLAYNSQYYEAFELYTTFLIALRATKSLNSEVVPAVVFQLYSEYLLLHLKVTTMPHAVALEAKKVEGTISAVERLLRKQKMKHNSEIVLILADLYVLKIDKSEQYGQWVTESMRHIENVLNTPTVSPGDVFWKARATRIACQALQKVKYIEKNRTYTSLIRKCFSTENASNLRIEAQTQHYRAFWHDLENLQESSVSEE